MKKVHRPRAAMLTIPESAAGWTLIRYLGHRFATVPLAAWERKLQTGGMQWNGRTVAGDLTLAAGDQLRFLADDLPEPPVASEIQVLYEDEVLLVVDKPAPLPVHPHGSYYRHTLWWLLAGSRPDLDLFPVNRLDRETSGIVLLAKDGKTAARLQLQFAAATVRKGYLAIVEGDFPQTDRLRVEGSMGEDPIGAVRYRKRLLPAPAAGPPCRTDFSLREKRGGRSMLCIRPHTGRQHQIRATLKYLGHPVVGDKLYCRDESLFQRFLTERLTEADKRLLGMQRQALHAATLEIDHPGGQGRIGFEAPLPEDMRLFWQALPTAARAGLPFGAAGVE
ncbi:MAG: RluA family pseudouridine synthase [Thermodesulfobacteriota bacterium]